MPNNSSSNGKYRSIKILDYATNGDGHIKTVDVYLSPKAVINGHHFKRPIRIPYQELMQSSPEVERIHHLLGKTSLKNRFFKYDSGLLHPYIEKRMNEIESAYKEKRKNTKNIFRGDEPSLENDIATSSDALSWLKDDSEGTKADVALKEEKDDEKNDNRPIKM